MTIRIGFGYEQQEPGLYLWDDETGLIVASDDVDPPESIKCALTGAAVVPGAGPAQPAQPL